MAEGPGWRKGLSRGGLPACCPWTPQESLPCSLVAFCCIFIVASHVSSAGLKTFHLMLCVWPDSPSPSLPPGGSSTASATQAKSGGRRLIHQVQISLFKLFLRTLFVPRVIARVAPFGALPRQGPSSLKTPHCGAYSAAEEPLGCIRAGRFLRN